MQKVNVPPGLLRGRGLFKRTKEERTKLREGALEKRKKRAENAAKVLQAELQRKQQREAATKKALQSLKDDSVRMMEEPPKK